jgi:hypothetical protein
MSNRYEREIDELLRQLEKRLDREPLARRLGRRLDGAIGTVRGWLVPITARSLAEQMIFWSIVLVLLTFPMRYLVPRLTVYLSLASIVLFVGGIVLSISRRRRVEHRWRGRVIDLSARMSWRWRVMSWIRRIRK